MAQPFQQIKDLYKLQKEAREMQKKMKKLSVVGESRRGEVKITMNGLNEITDMQIDDSLMSPEQKPNLVDALQRAMEQARKALQKEMQKDFSMDDLKGMLGR